MKRTALSCVMFLALAIAAIAAPPDSREKKTVPRDISGVLDGRFTFEWLGPGEWDFVTIGDATGALRHFGLAKIYTKHIPNFATGELSHGEFEIVAANGDKIRGRYEGAGYYISSDQIHGNALLVIWGGTGRFVGAKGTINASFLETFDDPTYWSAKVTWALTGTVSY